MGMVTKRPVASDKADDAAKGQPAEVEEDTYDGIKTSDVKKSKALVSNLENPDFVPCRWLFRMSPLAAKLKFMFGCTLLTLLGPYVALQIAMCSLWEFLDKKLPFGGIYLCQKFSEWISPYCTWGVKNKNDGFVLPLFLWLGILQPAWFFYEFYYAVYHEFSWKRIVLYNIVRIGPQYMNFMYVYVLAHKEAHNYGTLFAKPYHYVLKNVFNHWVGLFHGVMPGNFTCAHVYNHHKYDNNEWDVVSCAFYARNNFKNWVTYLGDWFFYACNVSTILSFYDDGRMNMMWKTILSSIWYWSVLGVAMKIHPTFAFCTIVYPFFEANILLAVVNWVWHAFIDPDEPSNDFVNSTTIVEGLNFTLGEEYHVVHHQYAGIHWSKHEQMYEKHLEGYKRTIPSVFYKKNIFEIFAFIVSDDMDQLADCFYEKYNKGLSKKELGELLRKRCATHGPEFAKMRGRGVREQDGDMTNTAPAVTADDKAKGS